MSGVTVSVLLHFVGLCVFSDQIPGAPGLKVILPRVAYVDPRAPSNRMGGVTAPMQAATRHVEDHVAVLVFERAALQRARNWNVQSLAGSAQYSYVVLDGDEIQFDLRRNVAPGQMPKGGLKLPPLHSLCNGSTSLRGSYQPPYSGASAVVDLPRGAINACTAGLRVDTEVTLTATNAFVVYSGSGDARKELQFLLPARKLNLIIGNIPKTCLHGQCTPPSLNAADGIEHVHAYYEMVSSNPTQCSKSIKAWYEDLIRQNPDKDKPPIPECVMAVPSAAGGTGMNDLVRIGDPHQYQMSNFECSNSQWP